MKLLDLSIKNYRSIEDLILTFPTYYAAICGKNDSGKSNVLRALRSIFPIVGPSYFYREETISFKEDLPKWFGKDSKDKTINIRLRLSVDPESDAGLHGFLTTYLKLSEDKASLELIVGVTHSSETAEGGDVTAN